MISNLTATIMCLIEETGDRALISVRVGGVGGCKPPLPLPKFWATKIFCAAREILAKPIFTKVSVFQFVSFFSLKEIFFILSLSKCGRAS